MDWGGGAGGDDGEGVGGGGAELGEGGDGAQEGRREKNFILMLYSLNLLVLE